jgi:hypothetical protein
MKNITKTILTFTMAGFLCSCIGSPDIERIENNNVKDNFEEIFGFSYSPEQDWSTTKTGTISIHVDAPLNNIKEVQIIVYMGEDESLKILNRSEAKEGEIITLVYDTPDSYIALYVAAISEDGGYYLKEFKHGDSEVSFSGMASSVVKTRGTREDDNRVWYLEKSIIPYERQRGYPGFENELLYQLSEEDEISQIIEVPDFDPSFKTLLRSFVFTYLPNGKKYKNLAKIKENGYCNEDCYAITTGGDPVVISPVYKNDGGYHEVETCDIYYYYFKESDLVGKDEVQYIKDLPKYKAIKLSRSICADNEIKLHHSYKLIYWGDGIPEVGVTQGTYNFPAGYKIGFMMRSNFGMKEKQGEVYADGRLNNNINKHGHFKSSGLGENDPRMCWISLNKHMFLSVENLADQDFNDILLYITGIEPFDIPINPDYNSYTFLFEDKTVGDFDENDLVVRGERIGVRTVRYTLLACGAMDELYLKNISGKVLNENTEIHALFGQTGGRNFINTQSINYDYVSEEISVPDAFSFTDLDKQMYLYNKTEGKEIKLSRKGQDPHGIMIPYDFKWSKEKICIKDSYPEFGSWGQGLVESTDWYLKPVEELVINP